MATSAASSASPPPLRIVKKDEGPESPAVGSDPLEELDTVVAEVTQRDRQTAIDAAHTRELETDFLAKFRVVCQREVRPAMQAALERLRTDGGGGLIQEHPGGEARFANPSLILWMSLEGEIVGEPRPDRHPYLRLDAISTSQEVRVIEGDMWRGGGGRSGPTGEWKLDEITQDEVTKELVTIASRAGRP